MRLTNNLLVNMQIDRMNLTDSKGNAVVGEKLLSMLKSAPNQQLSLAAVLQSVNEGTGKFLVSGLGQLELPVGTQSKLTEQPRANITFSLVEGKINALIEFGETKETETVSTKARALMNPVNMLKQLGLQPTEQHIKALNQLIEYHVEPSAERIKQLAEGSFLASKTNEYAAEEGFDEVLLSKNQQVEWSKTLKSIVVDWLSRGNAEKTIQSQNQLQAVVLDGGLAEESLNAAKSSADNSGKNSAGVQTEKSTLNAPQELAGGAAKTSGADLSASLDGVKQMLKQLNPKTLIPLISADLEMNVENLHRSNQIFGGAHSVGQMKQLLIDKMAIIVQSVDPSQELQQDIAEWLESDTTEFALGKQLSSLESLITKHSPDAAEQLKENFEQINKAANMLEQVSGQMLAMHLPIVLGNHETQIELYVNKRRSRNAQEDFRMLLALNTNTLGQVQVLVTDQASQVEVQFKLADESIKNAFEAAKAEFETLLEDFDVKKVKVSFSCHFNEPAILEAMKILGSETVSSIDMRV